MNILICSPGDRSEDSIPELFCSIDKLKESIIQISNKSYDGDGFSNYKIFVLIPNKRVTLKKNADCDIYFDMYYDNDDIKIIVNNLESVSFDEFVNHITNIYNKKSKLINQ